jgi:hypothetical protein
VRIDTSGPVFGRNDLVEKIASSPELIMFANRRQLPEHPDVIEISVTDPTPVYPWSLMWHEANRHPSLPLLIAYVKARYRPYAGRSQWLPVPDRALFPADPDSGS